MCKLLGLIVVDADNVCIGEFIVVVVFIHDKFDLSDLAGFRIIEIDNKELGKPGFERFFGIFFYCPDGIIMLHRAIDLVKKEAVLRNYAGVVLMTRLKFHFTCIRLAEEQKLVEVAFLVYLVRKHWSRCKGIRFVPEDHRIEVRQNKKQNDKDGILFHRSERWCGP